MTLQLDPTWLLALLLASARILAWALVAPPLATAALALAVVPVARAHVPAAQTVPILGALVVQVALGAGLGFLTRLVFTAVESAGSLLDLVGGFSLAVAYDPFNANMNSVFGRFYAMFTTTLIFVTDVHLVILRGFLRTFTSVPLDAGFSLDAMARHATSGLSDLFVAALQIAGPMIVVLFLADVALGVLNRIAPQLNAFSLSFPLKIALTLLLVGLGFTLMPQTVVELGTRAADVVTAVTT